MARGALDHDDAALSPDALAVCQELAAARRAARLTWEDVGRDLRMRPQIIEALEAGDISATPGRAYFLGYLRAYARYLDLDAEALLDRFQGRAPAVRRERPEAIALDALAEDAPEPQPSRRSAASDRPSPSARSGGGAMAWMLIILVVAGLAGGLGYAWMQQAERGGVTLAMPEPALSDPSARATMSAADALAQSAADGGQETGEIDGGGAAADANEAALGAREQADQAIEVAAAPAISDSVPAAATVADEPASPEPAGAAPAASIADWEVLEQITGQIYGEPGQDTVLLHALDALQISVRDPNDSNRLLFDQRLEAGDAFQIAADMEWTLASDKPDQIEVYLGGAKLDGGVFGLPGFRPGPP